MHATVEALEAFGSVPSFTQGAYMLGRTLGCAGLTQAMPHMLVFL